MEKQHSTILLFARFSGEFGTSSSVAPNSRNIRLFVVVATGGFLCGSIMKSKERYEVSMRLQVAADQSGKDTSHDSWRLMNGFSMRSGVAAIHCIRWLANKRLPRVRGDSWYRLAEVVGSKVLEWTRGTI
ncbi:hypothetical protein Tco_0425271 [Tanacetum coccineum]